MPEPSEQPSIGLDSVIVPAVPEDLPDAATAKELKHVNKQEKKRQAAERHPPPSVLLNNHREQTEVRLIEEVDQARDRNDALVEEIRNVERKYAALGERCHAIESQRSNATICAGIGALTLAIASFCDPPAKWAFIGIGGCASIIGICTDIRGCIDSWRRPIPPSEIKS